MLDGRSEQRKNAKAFFGVYDRTDGELIGYLLDLTTSGMRLKSLKVINPNSSFEFRMDLPVEVFDSTTITFRAKSKWCKKCDESRYYEIGFKILECSSSEAEKIESLLDSDLFAAEGEKLHISISMMEW
jgi:hypothetical protein